MSITKLPDGLWFVDVEPIKDKRFRKRFKTKGEAQRSKPRCGRSAQRTWRGASNPRIAEGSPSWCKSGTTCTAIHCATRLDDSSSCCNWLPDRVTR